MERQFLLPGLVLIIVVVVVSYGGSAAEAAITFNGAKCGTKLCRVDEFCSKYDTQCEKCSTICDESTHNFDKEMCVRECQDYLHDIRYARRANGADELISIRRQLNLVLILLVIVLVLLAVSYAIHLGRWCKGRGLIAGLLRKMKLKKPSKNGAVGKVPIEELTRANPHTQSPKVQLRIRTDMRGQQQNQANRESTVFSVGAASTIQTVSTPISTRYPAEDSTLSYSYDNAGLAVTPTIPDRPRAEF